MRDPGGAPGYRPEIDGLRALAVAPVILFHAGFAPFKGGYVGVDVFFVISGYLITSILQREIESGSFSIAAFYERRIRRILPALVVVAAACIPMAWMWMLPIELRDFGQSLVGVSLFSSNVLFWWESGYFDTASEAKPLLHTWSLGIEEQFYVAFPLLLYCLRRTSPRTRLAVIAALILISLALAQWGARAAPSATFYLLPTRAWELGAGALAALTAPAWTRITASRRGAFLAEALGAAGVALILFATLAFDRRTSFPGPAGIVPVAGAVAVILFARPTTIAGRVLALPPLVGLGLVSYSAYLWHQPIFAFARLHVLVGEIPPAVYALLVLLTLGLAVLTWKLVEQPFRRPAVVSRRHVLAGAGAAGAAVLGAGVFLHVDRGAPERMPEVQQFAHWLVDGSPNPEKCRTGARDVNDPDCIYGAGGGAPLEVWGDSNGVELAWQLTGRLTPYGLRVHELTKLGCAPIDSHEIAALDWCTSFHAEVFEHLRHEDTSAPVVVVGAWASLFDPHSDGRVTSAQHLDERDAKEAGEQLRENIRALLDAGRRVVLLYPIPQVDRHPPKYLQRRLALHAPREAPLSTSYEEFIARARSAYDLLDLIPDDPGLLKIRPSDILCGTFMAGRCVAELDGAPLYFDRAHLNSVGAGLIADALIAQMEQRGWLSRDVASNGP